MDLKDAILAIDAEIHLEATGVGDQAHDIFRAVDVEIVHDQVPTGGGVALCEQPSRQCSRICSVRVGPRRQVTLAREFAIRKERIATSSNRALGRPR
jgi:hypothetical protein